MLPRLRSGLRGILALFVRRPEARALAALAVEEIVANVADHGYSGREGLPISLTMRPLGGERFQVRVLDRAPVRDVTLIEAPDLAESARRLSPRGRGLALVRLIANSVVHRGRSGGGNALDLVFDAAVLSRIVEENFREAA